jgi:hypothetical protein
MLHILSSAYLNQIPPTLEQLLSQRPPPSLSLDGCRMDKLQAFGCCHFYSARDYSLEGECADAGCRAGPAVLPEKAGPKSSGTFLESISCPQSPIMAR